MSTESELQKEWRDIVISKLNSIEADQKSVQLQLANSVAVASDVRHLQVKLAELEVHLKDDFVTKSRYETVERIVYGVTTIVIVGVATAIIALVLRK